MFSSQVFRYAALFRPSMPLSVCKAVPESFSCVDEMKWHSVTLKISDIWFHEGYEPRSLGQNDVFDPPLNPDPHSTPHGTFSLCNLRCTVQYLMIILY